MTATSLSGRRIQLTQCRYIYKASDDQTTGLFIEKATGASGTASIFFGVTAGTETNNVGIPKAGILFERTQVNGRGDLKFCVDVVDDTNPVGIVDAKLTIAGSNGNVGIGTTTPGATLHVNGGIKSGGYVTTTGIATTIAYNQWVDFIDFRSYTYGRRRNFIQGYRQGLSLAGNATFFPVTDTANWNCTLTQEFNYGGVEFRVFGNYIQAKQVWYDGSSNQIIFTVIALG